MQYVLIASFVVVGVSFSWMLLFCMGEGENEDKLET